MNERKLDQEVGEQAKRADLPNVGQFLTKLSSRGRERFNQVTKTLKTHSQSLILASAIGAVALSGCAELINSQPTGPAKVEQGAASPAKPTKAPTATRARAIARVVEIPGRPSPESSAASEPENGAQALRVQVTAEAAVRLASMPAVSARQRITNEDSQRFRYALSSTFLNFEGLPLNINEGVVELVKTNPLVRQRLIEKGIDPDSLTEGDFLTERPSLGQLPEVLQSIGVSQEDAERFQVGKQILVTFRKADGSIGADNFTIGPTTDWAAKQIGVEEAAVIGKQGNVAFVMLQVCGNEVAVPVPIVPTATATATEIAPSPTETATTVPAPAPSETAVPTAAPSATPAPTGTSAPEQPEENGGEEEQKPEDTPVPATATAPVPTAAPTNVEIVQTPTPGETATPIVTVIPEQTPTAITAVTSTVTAVPPTATAAPTNTQAVPTQPPQEKTPTPISTMVPDKTPTAIAAVTVTTAPTSTPEKTPTSLPATAAPTNTQAVPTQPPQEKTPTPISTMVPDKTPTPLKADLEESQEMFSVFG